MIDCRADAGRLTAPSRRRHEARPPEGDNVTEDAAMNRGCGLGTYRLGCGDPSSQVGQLTKGAL